ncbi:hypothetical protein IscW_ISCW014982 [Ixodes scapularis]|uniref:Uncharacterized protein n=1 Tax=Ixodes scapularis TaxID=6945 RepID=B7QKC5_IXOSC|nr:hypothetical protein IscW_ISCW014982 [Ixodes scapularis]|eukprot:XP_002415630.1 hypothetical protein IscW_ISCW014982 [Ixodes scapularis]
MIAMLVRARETHNTQCVHVYHIDPTERGNSRKPILKLSEMLHKNNPRLLVRSRTLSINRAARFGTGPKDLSRQRIQSLGKTMAIISVYSRFIQGLRGRHESASTCPLP